MIASQMISAAMRGIVGAVAFCVASLTAASSGHACSPIPATSGFTSIEEMVRSAEMERRAVHERLVALQKAQRDFRRRVHVGTIDSATHLATLLIPNPFNEYPARMDCSPPDDLDGPPSPRRSLLVVVFADSALDGLDAATMENVVSPRFYRTMFATTVPACNDEFRSIFTKQLREALPRRQRNKLLIDLSDSGQRTDRFYRFRDESRTRRPDAALGRDIPLLKAKRQKHLMRALDDFWTEAVPMLGAMRRTCPNSFGALITSRNREVERLRGHARYQHYFQKAALAREHR